MYNSNQACVCEQFTHKQLKLSNLSTVNSIYTGTITEYKHAHTCLKPRWRPIEARYHGDCRYKTRVFFAWGCHEESEHRTTEHM